MWRQPTSVSAPTRFGNSSRARGRTRAGGKRGSCSPARTRQAPRGRPIPRPSRCAASRCRDASRGRRARSTPHERIRVRPGEPLDGGFDETRTPDHEEGDVARGERQHRTERHGGDPGGHDERRPPDPRRPMRRETEQDARAVRDRDERRRLEAEPSRTCSHHSPRLASFAETRRPLLLPGCRSCPGRRSGTRPRAASATPA